MKKQEEVMQRQRQPTEKSMKTGAATKASPPVQLAQCGSCIFREDGNQVELAPGRLDEIRAYLLRGTAHRCHHPEAEGRRKTVICRGGRDWQLQAWHRMGLIVAPTDEALTAKMVELGLWRKP